MKPIQNATGAIFWGLIDMPNPCCDACPQEQMTASPCAPGRRRGEAVIGQEERGLGTGLAEEECLRRPVLEDYQV
jgi:hypothetical protein